MRKESNQSWPEWLRTLATGTSVSPADRHADPERYEHPPFEAARSNGMPVGNTMTKESIRAIIDSVEFDPLAGMGCFTKKDLLVDRLLAHCRTAQQVAS